MCGSPPRPPRAPQQQHTAFGSRVASPPPDEVRRRCRNLKGELQEAQWEEAKWQESREALHHRAVAGRVALEVAQQRLQAANVGMERAQERLRLASAEREAAMHGREEAAVTEESWIADREAVEAETEQLAAHCAELRRSGEQLRGSRDAKEAELRELEDTIDRDGETRAQLQATCLTLQQECESARNDLREAEATKRSGGDSVQQRSLQKIRLERTMQELRQQEELLQLSHAQKEQQWVDQVAIDQRQQELLIKAAKVQIEKLRDEAQQHMEVARRTQQDLTLQSEEEAALERSVAEEARELEQLQEQSAENASNASKASGIRDAAAEEMRQALVAKRAFEQQLTELHRQRLDLEERRIFALSKVRSSAARALEQHLMEPTPFQDPWLLEQCEDVVAAVPPDPVLYQLPTAALPATVPGLGGARARVEAAARRQGGLAVAAAASSHLCGGPLGPPGFHAGSPAPYGPCGSPSPPHGRGQPRSQFSPAAPSAGADVRALWPPCSAGAARLARPRHDGYPGSPLPPEGYPPASGSPMRQERYYPPGGSSPLRQDHYPPVGSSPMRQAGPRQGGGSPM